MKTIISASRRTDIPAFYSDWFLNRIKAGYCEVPNPLNPNQVSRVSLRSEDIAGIVFWTRNPKPLIPHLNELNARAIPYYFQYTILNNPRQIDPKVPTLEQSLATFKKLAQLVGKDRVIWRYDPIYFTNVTNAQFHIDSFSLIADALKGFTIRSVISIVDVYRKIENRLRKLEEAGISALACNESLLEETMAGIVASAKRNGMEMTSCAEVIDLTRYGVRPGKCVDDELVSKLFNYKPSAAKDSAQRPACNCIPSRDIGMYDSCLFNCAYCYATSSVTRAKTRFASHDVNSPRLIPLSNES